MYVVVHCCATSEDDTGIITPLIITRVQTSFLNMPSIKHLVLTIHKPNLHKPVIRALCILRICRIPRKPREARANLEIKPIGDSVFIIIPGVKLHHLPPHPAITICCLPSRGLSDKDGLREGKPLGLVGGGVGVFPLCGCHGGEGPEGLVVIAELPRDVERLVVAVIAGLVNHGLCDGGVVASVAGEGPVVDEGL